MSEKPLDVGSHSKSLIGAAVTSATRATTGTIKNETGADAVIVAIDLLGQGAAETVATAPLGSGGLVEMENDYVDIKPCDTYVGGLCAITEGGNEIRYERYETHIQFPKDSTMTVYYTPNDDQSQELDVILHFELGIVFDHMRQTFIKSGIDGAAITTATIERNAVSIVCPAGKGGYIKKVYGWSYNTLETLLNSGALAQLHNEAHHLEPCDMLVEGNTCIDEGVARHIRSSMPKTLPFASTSTLYFDVTPFDNQSQLFAFAVVWTRGLN